MFTHDVRPDVLSMDKRDGERKQRKLHTRHITSRTIRRSKEMQIYKKKKERKKERKKENKHTGMHKIGRAGVILISQSETISLHHVRPISRVI